MPQRDYWLAPERRRQTQDRLSGFGALLFAIILLAVHAGFELAVSANLHEPIRFDAPAMTLVMGVAVLLALLLLVRMILSFRIDKNDKT